MDHMINSLEMQSSKTGAQMMNLTPISKRGEKIRIQKYFMKPNFQKQNQFSMANVSCYSLIEYRCQKGSAVVKIV